MASPTKKKSWQKRENFVTSSLPATILGNRIKTSGLLFVARIRVGKIRILYIYIFPIIEPAVAALITLLLRVNLPHFHYILDARRDKTHTHVYIRNEGKPVICEQGQMTDINFSFFFCTFKYTIVDVIKIVDLTR